MQGWRTNMEDAHSVRAHAPHHGPPAARPALLPARRARTPRSRLPPAAPPQFFLDLEGIAWFAVFDGHGGKEVAKYCALHLHEAFVGRAHFAAGRVEEALVDAFLVMDDQIRSEPGRRQLVLLAEDEGEPGDKEGEARRALLFGGGGGLEGADGEAPDCGAGCTSVVAVVKGGVLFVANAGDSRAVLCRAGGVCLEMSQDHKPTNEGERARILAAGGFVADGRVKGSLALSRAIGDLEFKAHPGLGPEAQMVTALPDVRAEPLLPTDEFILIACDGIWDVMTSQAAVSFVRARMEAGASPVEAASALCDNCLAPDTHGSGLGCDNMTAGVVRLIAAK